MFIPFGCQSMKCFDQPQSKNLIHFFQEGVQDHPCPTCKETMGKKAIIHLVRLDPSGTIAASKLSEHPGKKYGFVCDRSKELDKKGTRPSFFTNYTDACTCYECLLKVKYDLGKNKEKPVRQYKAVLETTVE